VSPGWIVTDEGEKQKQLLPTVTVTVVAVAKFGQKARSDTKIPGNTAMRSKKVFIRSMSHRTIANSLLLQARQQK
jgi:hypothetical protein